VQRTRDDIYTKIDEGTSFSSVRDKAQTYAPGKITSLRAAIIASAEPEKKVVYASRDELSFPVPRRDLVSEEDVREYARALENHYLAIIKSGKRIGV
jgi:hypothetical protein